MKKIAYVTWTIILTGCAHTWVGKPSYMFESEKAQCSYIARHGGGGFYAQGTQSYVASAQLGYTIGEIARTQEDFDDCMLAKGWRIADDSSSQSHQQPIEYVPNPKPSPVADYHRDFDQRTTENSTKKEDIVTKEKSTVSTTIKETTTKISEQSTVLPSSANSSLINNLDEAQSKCKELGFKPKSTKFGKCVLELSK